jgi:hypothetical protein
LFNQIENEIGDEEIWMPGRRKGFCGYVSVFTEFIPQSPSIETFAARIVGASRIQNARVEMFMPALRSIWIANARPYLWGRVVTDLMRSGTLQFLKEGETATPWMGPLLVPCDWGPD